jgi:hypothetical protein
MVDILFFIVLLTYAYEKNTWNISRAFSRKSRTRRGSSYYNPILVWLGMVILTLRHV